LRKELAGHRFRNILVSFDGDSSRQSVLSRAARLAQQNGAAIKLITGVEDLPWYTRLVLPAADDLQAILVRDKSEALEALAAHFRGDALDASAAVLRGRRHLETVREVLRGRHDLLMKEAEPNERVLFGSTDMHLLRDCPCPVWLVNLGHRDRPYTRVLAAVDPAPPLDELNVLHFRTEFLAKDPALEGKILVLQWEEKLPSHQAIAPLRVRR
jgi:nucleotide-binding universal stress UspA family protein